MYGYRYTPTSHVFPMPRHNRAQAAREVVRRRNQQKAHQNPATVELVEETAPGVWTPVELESVTAAPPTGPRDPFDGLPRARAGRKHHKQGRR